MRPVQPADLIFVVRALLPLDVEMRPGTSDQIVAFARAADHYRKRTGRAHVRFGTGSLMSAAQCFDLAPMPDKIDVSYLDCLALIVASLRVAATYKDA